MVRLVTGLLDCPDLVSPSLGIGENSRFTLSPKSESTLESSLESCLGILFVAGFDDSLFNSNLRLYKTRIWMASLQGGVSYEQ